MRISYYFVSAASLLASAAWAGPVNLVTNPGFETGDLSGWTQSGDQGITWVECGSERQHSGDCDLMSGPATLGFIAQNLATTPGATYELSYWLRMDVVGETLTPNNFEVFWNGALIRDDSFDSTFAYTEGVHSALAATGGSTELKFGFRQVPGVFLFDDVTVVQAAAVPEPSALLLCGLTLIGWAGIRIRRRAA